MARRSVQSTAAQASLTTFDGCGAAELLGAASPSGSSPESSGRLRSSRLIGARTTSSKAPMAMQAARQPASSMTSCTQGNRVMEPTPTPAKAMPIAIPRRRTNQLGRNSDWPE